MEVMARGRYIRISPRKVEQVIRLIRGKDLNEALDILKFTPKRASVVIEKVLRSAVANAVHNAKMDEDNLYVARACVDAGPIMKRIRPRAMGRATRILRRTSHITLVLGRKGKEETK